MLVYEQNDRFFADIPTGQIICISFRECWHRRILPQEGRRREGGRKDPADNLRTPEGSQPLRWQGSFDRLGALEPTFLLGHVQFLSEREGHEIQVKK